MSNLEFAGGVIITGLVVVFVVLVLLIAAIWVMGKMIGGNKTSKKPEAAKAPSAVQTSAAKTVPVAKASTQTEDGIPGEVVAAISAAVAMMMESTGHTNGYVVKSIKRAREARPAWGLAGIAENTRPF